VITPSQTIGPFYGPALLRDATNVIAGEGEAVRLEGRVLDGDGAPVPDALLELWRAEPPGFARVGTDDDGRYWVECPPTAYLCVTLFARGLLNHLSTRVYFEPSEADPVLQRVPPARRGTLLARRDGDVYRWDVVLQGDPESETAFFTWASS
jgi:protocatechuate 3,4-dioxygenase alpha subunit